MKRQLSARAIILLLAIALISTAALVLMAKDRGSGAAITQPKARLEFAATDLVQVRLGDLTRRLPLTGTLNPLHWVYVKSKAAGELREVYVREGEQVKKGQIIARLEVIELNARLEEKIANLESSRAQLSLAEKVRANNETLLRQGFISQNAYDNSQSGYLQAKGAVKANEAQVALARKALEDSIVRTPIDGIVAERLVQPGERVAVDVKLFNVMNLARMDIAASVPASEIGNVQVGQQVAFEVEGYGERQFTGRIDRINPATQAGSRSVPVYVVIDNADGALRGGVFAKGHIVVSKLVSVMTVEASALHDENGQAVVYRIDGNILKKQPVKLGLRNAESGLVQIIEGLEPGATVVKGNFVNLRDGAEVSISESPVLAKEVLGQKR